MDQHIEKSEKNHLDWIALYVNSAQITDSYDLETDSEENLCIFSYLDMPIII